MIKFLEKNWIWITVGIIILVVVYNKYNAEKLANSAIEELPEESPGTIDSEALIIEANNDLNSDRNSLHQNDIFNQMAH